jgi:hypothetical protein
LLEHETAVRAFNPRQVTETNVQDNETLRLAQDPTLAA